MHHASVGRQILGNYVGSHSEAKYQPYISKLVNLLLKQIWTPLIVHKNTTIFTSIAISKVKKIERAILTNTTSHEDLECEASGTTSQASIVLVQPLKNKRELSGAPFIDSDRHKTAQSIESNATFRSRKTDIGEIWTAVM